jgi:sensor histidine kinase regulating citrate/malate metabolism
LSGHGFGLHTCAIDINTMGGEISVKSEGLEQGASFIIKLPYRKAL